MKTPSKQPLIYAPQVLSAQDQRVPRRRKRKANTIWPFGPRLRCYHLWDVLDGYLELIDGQGVQRVSQGHAILVTPSMDLKIEIPGSTNFNRVQFLAVHQETEQVQRSKPPSPALQLIGDPQPDPKEVWGLEFPTVLSHKDHPYLSNGCHRICSNWWRSEAHRLLANAELCQLLARLVIQYHDQEQERHEDPLVHEALTMARNEYPKGISATLIAKRLNISRANLNHRIAMAGHPPLGRFLAKLRLEDAIRRLELEKRSVQQIAKSVGYTSSSSFIRAFRQAMGATPRQYRLQRPNKAPESLGP